MLPMSCRDREARTWVGLCEALVGLVHTGARPLGTLGEVDYIVYSIVGTGAACCQSSTLLILFTSNDPVTPECPWSSIPTFCWNNSGRLVAQVDSHALTTPQRCSSATACVKSSPRENVGCMPVAVQSTDVVPGA